MCIYGLLGLIIIVVTVILGLNIQHVFRLPVEISTAYYQRSFMFFGIGTAIMFPFLVSQEILHGLNKIYLRNFISVMQMLLTLFLTWFALSHSAKIMSLTFITLGLGFVENILYWFIIHRNIPQFRFDFRYFDTKLISGAVSFSLFAYIITCSNLLIFRTDQIVISVFLGISSVALFQVSSRITQLFQQFSSQFQSSITPVASGLFVKKEGERLVRLIIGGNRAVGFISTFLVIPLFIYLPDLLRLWLEVIDPRITLIGRVLLISMFIYQCFRSSNEQILLMCDKHKVLAGIVAVEAVLNLVLSIFFLRIWGVIGVAIGTLVPNIIVVFVSLSIAVVFAKVGILQFFKRIYFRNILVLIINSVIAYGLNFYMFKHTLFSLFLVNSVYVLVFLVVYFMIGLSSEERKIGTNYFGIRFPHKSSI